MELDVNLLYFKRSLIKESNRAKNIPVALFIKEAGHNS